MFEVPDSDIVAVRIDEEVLAGKKPIEYVRKPKSESSNTTETPAAAVEETTSLDDAERKKTYA